MREGTTAFKLTIISLVSLQLLLPFTYTYAHKICDDRAIPTCFIHRYDEIWRHPHIGKLLQHSVRDIRTQWNLQTFGRSLDLCHSHGRVKKWGELKDSSLKLQRLCDVRLRSKGGTSSDSWFDVRYFQTSLPNWRDLYHKQKKWHLWPEL